MQWVLKESWEGFLRRTKSNECGEVAAGNVIRLKVLAMKDEKRINTIC